MFRVDRTHEPFIYQQVSGHLTEVDLTLVGEFMGWAKDRPLLSLIDCRGAERPDSTARAKLAEVMKRHAQGTKGVQALVFSNKLVSGAMTALRWVVPSPNPEIYVGSNEEGLRFLEDVARKRGLSVPAEFRRMVMAMDVSIRALGQPSSPTDM